MTADGYDLATIARHEGGHCAAFAAQNLGVRRVTLRTRIERRGTPSEEVLHEGRSYPRIEPTGCEAIVALISGYLAEGRTLDADDVKSKREIRNAWRLANDVAADSEDGVTPSDVMHHCEATAKQILAHTGPARRRLEQALIDARKASPDGKLQLDHVGTYFDAPANPEDGDGATR